MYGSLPGIAKERGWAACNSLSGLCDSMHAYPAQGERVSDRPAAAAQAPMGAVFLSYASEDTAAAERIATALRSVGIEVWSLRTRVAARKISPSMLWRHHTNAESRTCFS